MLPMNDDDAAKMGTGPGLNPTDGFDANAAGDYPVTEFLVPWINARGKIQMIQAYLC